MPCSITQLLEGEMVSVPSPQIALEGGCDPQAVQCISAVCPATSSAGTSSLVANTGTADGRVPLSAGTRYQLVHVIS